MLKTNLNLFETQLPNSAIAVDWLSLYCIGSLSDNPIYTFKLLDYSTRTFRKVHEIFYKTEKIGTCTSEPTSKIINPRAVIVKFENRLLYSRSIKFFISKFLKTCKLYFKSITRADICRDFTTFTNNLNPPQFILNFFDQSYIKNGRSRFYAIGNPGNRLSFDYLRFGSRSTGKTIYLYNKTKELSEQKKKPWINDFWALNNLINGKDIWRLEFSFKGSQNKKMNKDTGEFRKIHWTDLFNPVKLYALIKLSFQQYFNFKINNGTQNKTEMETLNLFNDDYSAHKLIKLPDDPDETKTIRSVLRQLVSEHEENKITLKLQTNSIESTITELAQKYNLIKYINQTLNFIPCQTNLTSAFLS